MITKYNNITILIPLSPHSMTMLLSLSNSPGVRIYAIPGLLLPSCIRIYCPPWWKPLETHTLCWLLVLFRSLYSQYHNIILTAKKTLLLKPFSSSSDHHKRIWQSFTLAFICPINLAHNFASFFTDKISKRRLSLAKLLTTFISTFAFFL